DYDLVFLDIRMPGISGLEVAQRLAEKPHAPSVIFTTAYPDHAVEAFDLAASDYLVKPFDADRLKRAVERALAGGHAKDEDDDAQDSRRPEEAADSGTLPNPLVRIPVQKDGRTVLVEGDAIVYAAAARGYSSLKLMEEKVLVSF